jgi:ankyrin repeat protein
MKSQLIAIVAAVLVVGCGPSVHDGAYFGNIEVVKQHLADGVDVNAKLEGGRTPLDSVKHIRGEEPQVADLLRKHGGKTGEELKAEGK